MRFSRHLVILTLAGLICGCAGSPLSRSAALDLHQKLGQSRVGESYPDEYRSFIATIAQAETLAQRGESLQSENVYRLALRKGRLLEMRLTEPAPATSPVRQMAAQVETPPRNHADSSARLPPAAPDKEAPATSLQEKSAHALPEMQEAPLPEPVPEEMNAVAPQDSPTQFPPEIPPQKDKVAPPPPVSAGEVLPTADMRRFIGNRGSYTVRKGESLKRVGARLGVEWRQLAKINGLDPKAPLAAGQRLIYDNRKIVPSALRDGIVINIADRTLYLLKNGAVNASYPVAVGKPPKPEDDEDWSTPTGRFIITAKTKDPVWKVPQSIQDEMEQRGKEPIKEMPPGKDNPLGKYAMKTSLSGIVIHSTNAPSSIYSYASHGCIRVMPEHMEKLFPVVEPRTSGMIVYQPVKLAVSPDGRVFLEVNRDVYDRYQGNLEKEVRRLVTRRKVEDRVDWNKIGRVLKKKSGIPEEITGDGGEAVRLKPAGRQKTVSVVATGTSLPVP